MNINKRGQATPFIIVGIIVVVLVVIVIFISKPTALGGGLSSSQVQPIKNYVDECIKTKVNEELINLRNFGGYPGLGNNKTGDFRILGRNINPGRDIEHDLEDYLKNNCKVKETFSDFSIDSNDAVVSVDMEDEKIIVNVKWPITIRKDVRSIVLEEFSYSKDDDLKWINDVLIASIINEKLSSVASWVNDNKYGDKISYYDANNNLQDIKITDTSGYMTYVINTKFGRVRGLNDFRFAIKK